MLASKEYHREKTSSETLRNAFSSTMLQGENCHTCVQLQNYWYTLYRWVRLWGKNLPFILSKVYYSVKYSSFSFYFKMSCVSIIGTPENPYEINASKVYSPFHLTSSSREYLGSIWDPRLPVSPGAINMRLDRSQINMVIHQHERDKSVLTFTNK